jgi:dipeptidyl aminopeptidase/acylaminoacyl peptidase
MLTRCFLVWLLLVGSGPESWSAPRRPSGSPRTLVSGNWSDLSAWPDRSGRRVLVAYTEEREAKLFVTDIAHPSSLRPVLLGVDPEVRTAGYELRDVRWSPQGDRIAIEVVSEDVAETYLWYAGSGAVERIGFGPVASSSPRWDPQGRWMFFLPGVVDPEHDDGLYVYDTGSKRAYKALSGHHLDRIEIAGDRLIAVGSADRKGNAVITVTLQELRRSAVEVARWDAKKKTFVQIGREPLPEP